MRRSNTLCVPDDHSLEVDTTTKNESSTNSEQYKHHYSLISQDTIIPNRIDTSPSDEFGSYFPIYNQTQLVTSNYDVISHSFKSFVYAITSDELQYGIGDLGIDRSVDTRYSRSGFFEDCYRADLYFIGSCYLDFSIRFPLIFCMIRTNNLARCAEIQRGIVPLAVTLFDRYLKYVSPNELKNKIKQSMHLDLQVEIVLNLLACTCYCIADKYDGCENISLEVLLNHWIAMNKELLITRAAGEYIESDKAQMIKVIKQVTFDVYKQLDYKLTIPLIPFLSRNLVNSSTEIPRNSDPFKKTKYQREAYIYSMISIVDNSIMKYKPSILALAIYELIRLSAIYDGTLIYDVKNWIVVDKDNNDIKSCMSQILSSLRLFVDTELLERLLKPIDLSVTRKCLLLALFDIESSEFYLLSPRLI